MKYEDKIIEIFIDVDDFCQKFLPFQKKHLLSQGKRNRLNRLSYSEIMTIQILFHYSEYRNFKKYYKDHVCKCLTSYFPDLQDQTKLLQLKEVLLKNWNEILFYDYSIRETHLSEKQRMKLLKYKNPLFWESMNNKERYYHRRFLEQLIKLHSVQLKEQIKQQIDSKFTELCKTVF